MSASLVACGGSSSSTDKCDGDSERCDDPNSIARELCIGIAQEKCGPMDQQCVRETFFACRDEQAFGLCDGRRPDALGCAGASRGSAFTAGAIRWACADVPGVSTGSKLGGGTSATQSRLADSGDRGFGRAAQGDDAVKAVAAGAAAGGDEGKPDSRGQEYCEYFALVQVPEIDQGQVVGSRMETIGQLLPGGRDTTGHEIELPEGDALDDLIDTLSDDPNAVWGQCMFSSWHGDVDRPLEVCDGGSCPNLPAGDNAASWVGDSYEMPLDARNFQMKISINANFAAVDLVDKCSIPADQVAAMSDAEREELGLNPAKLSPDVEDSFSRGCIRNYELFTTEWRRSDPTICNVPQRLAECGCGLDVDADGAIDVPADLRVTLPGGRRVTALSRLLVTDPDPSSQAAMFNELADAVEQTRGDVPLVGALRGLADRAATQPLFLRGFPLGTWTDEPKLGEGPAAALSLPEGCRYININGDSSEVNGGAGENGKNIVACDITTKRITDAGMDIEQAFLDMKSFCQRTYAQDVVVHIPYVGSHIPEANIICDVPQGSEDMCGDIPALIGREGGEANPSEALCRNEVEVEEPDPDTNCCKTCVKGDACGDTCVKAGSCKLEDPDAGCACKAGASKN